MNYSPNSRDALDAHCRVVIRSCLNIVEQHGDTYVAIHKDDEVDCVVLVSMIRSYPIMSIIVADKILFADINAEQMYGAANELNLDSVTGWHPARAPKCNKALLLFNLRNKVAAL